MTRLELCVYPSKSIAMHFLFSDAANFTIYSATDRNIKIYVGDVFNFASTYTGIFDCAWECNAIVALNVEDRERYASLLATLIRTGGKILMTTWEYNQSERRTHPFSVPHGTVRELFKHNFDVELIESIDATGTYFTQNFKLTYAFRPVHLLTKNN